MARYIITGGASGIGKSTALAMLMRGDHVGVIDLNQDNLDAFTAEVENTESAGRFTTAAADVSDESEMKTAIDGFAERFDGIDGIVNNAGIGGAFGPAVDLRVEDWDATFAVLTRGPFIGTKHVARILIEQGTGGQIVNVGSIAGLLGDAGPQAYSVAKAATIHMSRVFAAEFAPHRVSVNTVNPGYTATPLNPINARRTEESFAAAQPWPDAGRPEHIAHAILFFANPATAFITGEVLSVDGGMSAIGHRLGTAMGTNSLQYGRTGMNYGGTGRQAVIRGAAEDA